MRNTDKQLALSFEKGGNIGSKYISRQQLNTITIKKKDGNLTYKFSDVLNGAYTLKDGGDLTTFANYIPLRSIVKVQLKNGKNVKPINGYWLKKTAKPIRFTKFEDGGDISNPTRDEFMKKEIEKQTLKEKGQNFKKYKVNVYVQDNSGAFPFIEPYFTDNVVEAINFAKETIKKSSSANKNGNSYWATIDRFVPISKRANVIYAYSELERFTESDVNSSKYANGGVFKKSLKPVYGKLVDFYRTEKIKDWYIKNYPTDDLGKEINNLNTFENLWNGINNQKNVYTIIGVGDSLIRERLFQNLSLIYDVDYDYIYKKWLENTDDFARGGAIKQSSKIERKVAEVNSLIKEAFDNENDPLYVFDPTSTWESPMIYKEVIYRNGRLYIEYYEPHSSFSQIQKEVINKSNMEMDGYPTLLYIAKMYRKAIKKFKSGKYNNEDEDYKNGGNLNNSDNDLKLAYLTDLWFAVHQKESKGYNKIGKELDKLNVPYSVQNNVSDDAFENRGRKNPSVSEVKLFINKILTKKGSFANGGSIDKLKVGSKVGFLRPHTGRYEYAEILSFDGDNVNMVVRHPKNKSWDNYFTETLSRIEKYSDISSEDWSDKKLMKLKFEHGGSINKQITFKDWKGDIRVGTITEKLPNGYEVLTDNGVALVKDNEIID